MNSSTARPGADAHDAVYNSRVANGAKIVAFAGYEMPIQYPTGVSKEHLHMRELGKRCSNRTFFAWGEQANVGAQGAPTYVDFRAKLTGRGRLRALRERSGIDFTSNDYLGLAESEELRRAAADAVARGVPVGSGGSRLLRGNHPEHEALESEAAAYFGADTALYFGGGYVANFTIFSDSAATWGSRGPRRVDSRERP